MGTGSTSVDSPLCVDVIVPRHVESKLEYVYINRVNQAIVNLSEEASHAGCNGINYTVCQCTEWWRLPPYYIQMSLFMWGAFIRYFGILVFVGVIVSRTGNTNFEMDGA